MFKRAGGEQHSSGRKSDNLSQTLSQIVTAIMPKSSITGNSASASPPSSKIIEGRSRCYRQLADLKNLKDTCILTSEEFEAEREAILQILRGPK